MKDILQDVVAKTHALGFLSLVKVNSEADATTIESIAEDRSVILNSTTHSLSLIHIRRCRRAI